MTQPPNGFGRNGASSNGEPAPNVALNSVSRTGAGNTVVVALTVGNAASTPRILTVTVLGLDAAWLPLPMRLGPIPAGGTHTVDFELRPPIGTLPARYPFAVTVQASNPALDPTFGRAASAATVAESALVVDEASRLSLEVTPADSIAVFGKRLHVVLRNSGNTAATVELGADVSDGARVTLNRNSISVPPDGAVRIGGRIKLTRPRLFGNRSRHPFRVTARGLSAPSGADGSITARPMFGSSGLKLLAATVVVSLWATLAVVGIPKLANAVKGKQSTQVTAVAANPSAGGTAGASGSPRPGTSSGAGGGAAGGGAAGAAGGSAANGVRLNGTVTGTAPTGVTVALRPTSLVDEAAQGAQPVGESTHAMADTIHQIGKVSATQVSLHTETTVSAQRSTQTTEDGSWSFAGISAPGYYLLTFAKPGYQTRRYVLNAADASVAQPLAVLMTAGQGSMSGVIRGPGGTAVGGASITISDGTTTVSTSSASKGSGTGSWKVDGLSTPGTFLVSASKDGLSLESSLVTLAAGASQTVNLNLRAGVASLVGSVQGVDSLGNTSGVGGATVTATNGSITRTASTVTNGPVGSYALPALPVPGTYTVAVSATGFLPQTQKVTLATGQSRATINAMLTSSSAVVQGTVRFADVPPKAGVGLVLTNSANTYKTMSVSTPAGSFRFNGVASGTYVLSADFFGYSTSYATVRATAGGISTATLQLEQVPGGVLPANSHIRGRAFDARTGGPLSCDQSPDPIIAADHTKCTFSVSVDDARSDGTHHFNETGIAPNLEYTVPEIGTNPPDGLLPGLHRVTISAPGYEDATVDVQVPLGGTVEAPQVAMYPTATISGLVTSAAASMSSGPDPAFPDDPDAALPQGNTYAHQKDYNTCVLAVSGTAISSTVPSCTPSADGKTCTSDAGVHCTLATMPPADQGDPPEGSFALKGLLHGPYLAYVRPLNPEFPPPIGTPIVLGLGETKAYDPTVHRLGRILLAVQAPNASGTQVNAPNVPVSVSGPTNVTGRVTGVQGRVRITGLQPGNYRLTAGTGSTQVQTPANNPLPVGSDQEVSTLLTQPIPAVIGRVTSTFGGTATGLNGASVTVTGVVGANGSRDSVTIVTGASGCFAVTADGAPPPAGLGACSTVSDIAVGKLGLITGQVDLTVTATSYETLTLPGQSINSSSLLGANLQPAAQQISGTLSLSPADPSVNLAQASIQVTRKPSSTGAILVTAVNNGDGTAHLTWQDSNYGQTGVVRPGLYSLTATLGGYAPASVDFECTLGTACTIGSFVLGKLGGLTISTVDSANNPVPDAVFVLSGGGGAVTQIAAPGANSVTFDSLTPGTGYTVKIQAAGYAFGTTGAGIPVTCGAATSITIPAGSAVSCTATLTKRSAIVGVTRAVLGTTNQPLSGVALQATPCADAATSVITCAPTGAAFTAVSGDGGQFRIVGTSSRDMPPGNYILDASSSGYDSPATVFVTLGAADTSPALDVRLTARKVTLKIGVSSSADVSAANLITNATLVLTATDGSQGPVELDPPAGAGNLYEFDNVVPTTYSLTVSGPNIANLTVQLTALIGSGTQTIYVRTDVRTNTISGKVSGQHGTGVGATAMDGALVELLNAGDGTTVATATSGSSGVAGFFLFDDVPDGSYLLRFSKAGYVTDDGTTVAVSAGQNSSVSLTLDRIKNNVVVNVNSVNGSPLSSSLVNLTAAPVAANPEQHSQSLSGLGTTYATTFNQVPSGAWTISVTMPTGHYGAVTSSGTAVTEAVPLPVTVSATVGTDTTVNLTVTETHVSLLATVTSLALDTRDPPSTVDFRVLAGTTIVTEDPSFATSAPGDASTSSIWLAPGTTYSVRADPGTTFGTGWTVTTQPFTVTSSTTAVAATAALVEKAGSVSATVTQSGADLAGATVTLTPVDTAISAPATVNSSATGVALFSNLPPGQWQISAAKAGKTSIVQTITVTTSITPLAVAITVAP
ncbi:MAG: hypothetical protein JWN95_2117 [Frankiales bacterium]|nr:hypothetical protein [Frankiales bacterium]